MFAQVALNVPVSQTYTYHIPEGLKATLQLGHLVRVAFGTSTQPAIVVGLSDTSPIIETKPVQAILDPQPVLSARDLRVAEWISERTLAPLGMVLWLWLPPAVTGKSTRIVHLLDENATHDDDITWQILSYLRLNNPQKTSILEREFGQGVRRILTRLEKDGLVKIETVLSAPRVRPKTIRTAHLVIDTESLHKWRFSPKQAVIVAYLAQFGYPVDLPELASNTGSTSADLVRLERKGVLLLGERIAYRDSLADRDTIATLPPELTHEQAEAWQTIHRALNTPNSAHSFLLHGVTGSGKTEIYLRAIAQTIAHKRQAIMLVPEIALTPQTIRRVATRFPDRVAIVHSGLSTGERFDTWTRARQGEIDVIIGTRSALFTPLPDCGLIIMDEEHDPSYKQSPPIPPPYYHARAVAERMMKLANGTLILGSATPDLETYYRAQKGDLTYLHLPNRIIGHKERLEAQAKRVGANLRYESIGAQAMALGLPPVEVIDMRQELRDGNHSMFSHRLQTALKEVLERNEQAILFLNRRGQATYVFCRDCGYVERCPRCETPMTYHRQGEALLCHHCGYRNPPPTVCANCASKRIRYFGAGTQQVEEELVKLFPSVRAVRWDADTAQKPDDHEALLAQFVQHEADVIVGTQMIAKGLDLPLVTLVGVISADTSLALPDFRTTERAFQLLTQVSGRAGRGVLGGEVILQTYQPDHESILASSQHDYALFYTKEIALRRELGYPPFRRLGRVLIQSTHPYEAQRQAEAVAGKLQHLITQEGLTDTSLIGPAPCFFGKLDNHYRWQVVVRGIDPARILKQLPQQGGQYIDIDPVELL